ncbi:magnesium chelatase domain-containing protein [Streptomyces althioticus]|uniref:magnesium chelatase domain-containing protein n=1 Tax=Streptomyces althioticus TaxID=83380 RepID=UPI00341B920A
MTNRMTTDPATAAHSAAFEIAYETATAARRSLFSQAAAYTAHLVRQHLPEAASVIINEEARELHEVLDAKGEPMWHAPTSAGHDLPDSVVDDVDGILRDVMPYGNPMRAARWREAPYGQPFRIVPLPEPVQPRELTPSGQMRVAAPGGVTVKAMIAPGVGSFILGGIKNAREVKDRVRAATVIGGYTWPAGQVVVYVETGSDELADGTQYDLAIAAAVLGATGRFGAPEAVLIGELGLNGQLRHVANVPDLIRTGQQAGHLNFLVPGVDDADARENADGVTVLSADSLATAISFLEEMTLS